MVITTLLAAVAFISFWPWVLELRRRPEFRFLIDGPSELRVGEGAEVSLSFKNTGDAVARDVHWNFVAPTILELTKPNSEARPSLATHDVAG